MGKSKHLRMSDPESEDTLLPTGPPERVLELMQSGKIRTLDNVTDLCAEMMRALMKKEVSANGARELRQWAELIFTSVQSQTAQAEGDMFITQLIQMNNQDTPLPVLEAPPTSLGHHPLPDTTEAENSHQADTINIVDIPEEAC